MAEVQADVLLGGRYRLLRRIAAGGMGSVWEADDAALHRRVAVKLPSQAVGTEPRFAERFRREALAVAGLSHPGVARVYDYGEDLGSPYIVMELVEGETLSERLRREGRIEHREAVRIAVAIAAALQAAHDAGIVHRDVKPGNVMITPSGDVRVLDFGIAAATGAAPLTVTGTRLGTATYLSPEQARGEPATPASDVYSLGVVLYEMLAGRPPFTAESPVAVAAQHIGRDPRPLSESVPEVPAGVAAACERALAKDPHRRPASAAAFAAMLTGRVPVTVPEPEDAPPTSPGEATLVLPSTPPTAVLPSSKAVPGTAAPIAHRRRIPAWALAAGLVAAGLVALLVFLAVSGGSSTPAATVAVPDVVGLDRGQAVAAIRGAGLEVGDVRAVEGQHGVVVRTDPPAGTRMAPGGTVTLYVGSSPSRDHGKGKGKGG